MPSSLSPVCTRLNRCLCGITSVHTDVTVNSLITAARRSSQRASLSPASDLSTGYSCSHQHQLGVEVSVLVSVIRGNQLRNQVLNVLS